MSDSRLLFALPTGTITPLLRRQSSSSSLTQAAKIIGVSQRTLRTLLEAEGKIRPTKQKGHLVPVATTDIARLKEDYATSISFAGVGPLLGVGGRIARNLRDSGELPVWIAGGKHGTKHRYLYRRQDLESWVDDLIGTVPVRKSLPRNGMLLADVPLMAKFPTLELVRAIREKRVIILGRLRGRPKFGCAIISIRNAHEHVPRDLRLALGSQRRGPRGPYSR